jgi:acetamidase/formamidase
MKTSEFLFPLILTLGTCALECPCPAAAENADAIAGKWEVTWAQFGTTNIARIELQKTGDQLSGKGLWNLAVEGSFTGEKLDLKVVNSDKKTQATLTGTVQGAGLAGTMKLKNDEFHWSAHRPSVRPQDSPKRHEFVPKQFHRYFAASIPPALRLWPGDTVHTETIDAAGIDKMGTTRSLGGNPLTGPFYIEGALNGDTLVVHFNQIRLNRDTAISGDSVVPSALEPGYKPKNVENFDSNWKLDRDKGVATLANPTEKLKRFTVPLQPFLGCVGVAPYGHQDIRSGDLGAYGGNLDYNQLREGTTAYLPVFEPGALLYIGDGHAAQGDGELTGDALETSMEVEFTVDLIQGKSQGPRIENDEYVMTLGVGNSLPDALQSATTQLARWLEEEYKLNSSEAAIVMGFAVKYDIAEVVDPHINVAAKIKKSALSGLNK